MASIYNYTWPQGEDLSISLVYKTGPSGSETPQDLTGYSLRMDIVNPAGIKRYTFNSAALADADATTPGDQPDNVTEATLGSDGTIFISVPRSLTLPNNGTNGELYADITANPPILNFNYDIFLRNPQNKQVKILTGVITIEQSYTLWP